MTRSRGGPTGDSGLVEPTSSRVNVDASPIKPAVAGLGSESEGDFLRPLARFLPELHHPRDIEPNGVGARERQRVL